MKEIAVHYRVPDPPKELRGRALNAARKQFQKSKPEDHRLFLSWAFAVTALVLFLIFWNPPIPASSAQSPNPNGFDSDPVLQQLYNERSSGRSMIARSNEMKLLFQERL
ncbi:hypothetical protein L0222_11470 [bacterium]|nr:hypothetical protein [bacterium]MCI0606425.1 hypothetical protein [bacterium]